MDLFDPQGRRLYLTGEERTAFLDAAARAPRNVRSLCLALHYTGCRVSEALALTPGRIDLSGKVIVFETLKKRRTGVFRAVPVPADMLILDMVHGLREAHKRQKGLDERLWPWTRTHAWRLTDLERIWVFLPYAPNMLSSAIRGYRQKYPYRQQLPGAMLFSLWLLGYSNCPYSKHYWAFAVASRGSRYYASGLNSVFRSTGPPTPDLG